MIEPAALRAAFGRYMTGVTVVTGVAPDGEPVGFTANSFTSVSLDPPMLLVCPGKHLSSFDVFSQTDHFAVNILAEGQERVSNIFARPHPDRFGEVVWQSDDAGCPLIAGRAAGFSCRVSQRVEAGDHVILIGEVTGFDDADQRGLGYCSSGYFSLGNERQAEAPARNADSRAQVILEKDGSILLTPDGQLPSVQLAPGTGARSALRSALEQSGVKARFGPVYAIYDQADGSRLTVLRGQAEDGTGDLTPVPIDQLDERIWADQAQAEMLRRFAQEFRDQSFGLYVGDAVQGEVHRMGDQ